MQREQGVRGDRGGKGREVRGRGRRAEKGRGREGEGQRVAVRVMGIEGCIEGCGREEKGQRGERQRRGGAEKRR